MVQLGSLSPLPGREQAAFVPLTVVGRLLALALSLYAVAGIADPVWSQQRPFHYFQRADMPPGSIGRAQLMRGGPLPGYFQAVEIRGPEGMRVALANSGVFEPTEPAPLKAGLLVGQVYRLKVTNIPFREGQELYPSIEIINRLYPPPGAQTVFPIPIELTREEMEMALRGQFVIRVIYLENPRTALPRQEDPVHQRYFEVGPGQDPLEVADGLGRPMAILRIGSRVPELDQVSGRFMFHSPPFLHYPVETSVQPTTTPAVPRDDVPPPTATLRPGAPATAQRPPVGVGVNR